MTCWPLLMGETNLAAVGSMRRPTEGHISQETYGGRKMVENFCLKHHLFERFVRSVAPIRCLGNVESCLSVYHAVKNGA